jgi:hypothetical protein
MTTPDAKEFAKSARPLRAAASRPSGNGRIAGFERTFLRAEQDRFGLQHFGFIAIVAAEA